MALAARVGRPAHVIVMRAGRIEFDQIGKAGGLELGAQDTLRRRGTADIAHTNQKNP
jgi:hypothetical protein